MRAQTVPKKGLSVWQNAFSSRYCHRSWSLKINYVTQLSALQLPHQLKRRQWHPTPVLSPGKSHGQRSLVVHAVAESWARLSDFTFTFKHWRRKWQPTPVFLPRESQGRGNLGGYSPRGRKESETTSFSLKDYITTVYPAWGQFLLPENLLTNPVTLKWILWEWVW